MKNKIGNINGGTTCFSGFSQIYKMNGGDRYFKVQDLEVFQLV